MDVEDKEPTVAFTVDVDRDEGPRGETIVFPPPSSWYKSTVAASRDDVWAYVAANMIVVVKPWVEKNGVGIKVPEEEVVVADEADKEDPKRSLVVPQEKVKPEMFRKWPSFTLIGSQREKYNCISFCQSSWDYLPVSGAPLVSGCDGGLVRVWNLEDKNAAIHHDNHLGQHVVGVDWSSKDYSVVYSIDDAGTMVVWNVKQGTLRSLNFGKIVPTSLQSCPQQDNVVCFGTKGGNVFVVETTGNGKILAKVRHDEEVVATLWKPSGDWYTLDSLGQDVKGQLPVLVSSMHSMKLPTIRIWNSNGRDIGMLQAWERDPKQRAFKVFGPAAWIRDPNSGCVMLCSTARHGEIVSWNNSTIHDIIHSVHGHNAIFAMVQCGDILWSMSYEPIIVGWNLRSNEVECIIPTFKGACTVAASPVDHSRLAIGGTDGVIRVLKSSAGYPSEGDGCTKSPLNSHRMKGKITAIAWHPTKDNCLGLGTDEGLLGIYELRENNKHAMIFDRRCNATVYTVAFGPSVYHRDNAPKHVKSVVAEESGKNGEDKSSDKEKDHLMLYACGGSAVYMINPSRPSNPLLSVSKIIENSNPHEYDPEDNNAGNKCRMYKATDIRWSPDYSFLAVGYNDGRIELYSPPHLKLKCWIKCHLKSIQYLSWRPFDFCASTAEKDRSSDRWLASTSNDCTTRLYNLGSLFQNTAEDDEPYREIISSEATFQGHGVRVISCAWSPHDKNLLVTVAYDSTAIVWNMEDGSNVARYMEHDHRLVACCFHPTDQFKVITISDELTRDCAVHVWDYREHPFRKNLPRSRPAGMAVPVKAISEIGTRIPNGIDQKRICDIKEVTVVKNVGGIHAAKKAGDACEDKGKSKHYKPKPKALMPLTSNALINGKHNQLTNELRFLVDKVPLSVEHKETDEECKQDTGAVLPTSEDLVVHLGVLGSRQDCLKQLKVERDSHGDKYLDNSAILSKWLDDTTWLEDKIKNGQVTESMLAIAASVNRGLYVKAMEAFANKLVEDEDYIKAANYYYLAGKVDIAVQILASHRLYREALALLKMTGTECDARVVDVVNKWIAVLITDGNYELAVKVACSVGQYANALNIIERRALPYAYKAACFIASKLNDTIKMEMFGVKFVLDAIPKQAYEDCWELFRDCPELKWMGCLVKTHEYLTGFAKYVAEISEMKEFNMWESVLSNLLDSAEADFLAYCDSGADGLQTKVLANILVSIAQNETDAEVVIAKNLTLMLLSRIIKSTEQDTFSKALETVKLAKTWLAVKKPALYFSVVMTATTLVSAWKYPPDEKVPIAFGACQHDATLGVLNSVASKLEEKASFDSIINMDSKEEAEVIRKLGSITSDGVNSSEGPFQKAKNYMEVQEISENSDKTIQACWTSFKEFELHLTSKLKTYY